jgi:hypothetical protein
MGPRGRLGGNRSANLARVPDDLREQYNQIVGRADALGQSVPVLEVAAGLGHSSRVILAATGETTTPRVRLSADLLCTPPVDRAWSIAHELGHVLRRQDGARPPGASAFLAVAAVLATGAVVCVVGVGWAMLRNSGPLAGALAAASLLQVGGLWLVLLALLRREETATDTAAAVIFGEVLTPAGVERLRRREGALSRYVPTLLRSHPHPSSRRRTGLDARSAR